MRHSGHRLVLLSAFAMISLLPSLAQAIPAFARQYQVTCGMCHAAVPKLNEFGEQFAGEGNMRLPNWKQNTIDTGDDMLALPKQLPLAIRAQAFVQARDGEAIDPISGATEADSSLDFQAPYLIKLLSSAPLTEQITYYFYAIFAEKGGNGEVLVEDAWFRYGDLFGTGVSAQLGQFQISDLMFPREIRLTFQDYAAYRMAGITYDRGLLFSGNAGPLGISVGATNGNGIEENFTINSAGFARPDHLFDNDTEKSVFARVSGDVGPASVGLFGLSGEQANATGPAGIDSGDRDTDKRIVGLDVSGKAGGNLYWFAQYLWNRWEGFLDAETDRDWHGGFAGVDYVHNPRWAFSALYNYADANDFDNTDTIYEGIDISSLTLTANYYFMRNVKGVLEVNADLLSQDSPSGTFATGHLANEHYVLFGIDAAF